MVLSFLLQIHFFLFFDKLFKDAVDLSEYNQRIADM